MRRGSITISLRALAQPLLHARSEDRMPVGRVGADHQDHVGLLDAVEILRARRGAEGLPEPVAGRRVADAGAGIDIVVAEARADQLLHEERLLVGAARGGDAPDRTLAMRGLDAFEFGCHVGDRLFPAHLAPGIGDLGAQHRLGDAIAMRGIAPGKAALDAAMAVIGLAILPRHHAHQRVAAHFRLEGAADAAIGAGSDHRMLWLTVLDHGFLDQRRGRAGLHAGTAGDAFRAEEVSSMPGETWLPNPRPPIVSAKVPCTSSQARTQREQTMHLL